MPRGRKKKKKEGEAGICIEEGCNAQATCGEYCRLHYIRNWSKIVERRRKAARDRLNRYIESMSEKYPDDYMEMIRDDLEDEDAFRRRLEELGFRRELESGEDNPFEYEHFEDLLDALKFEDS